MIGVLSALSIVASKTPVTPRTTAEQISTVASLAVAWDCTQNFQLIFVDAGEWRGTEDRRLGFFGFFPNAL